MDHKQLMLQELLQQDQEPFHLNKYIFDKRSRLNFSSPAAASQTSTHRSSCFFSFSNSPDVRKPPFIDFLSPAVRSPGRGAFLHVPSRTAAVLVEAAMRIGNQRQSKPKPQILNVGINLFGSFLKILKHRSKSRVLIDCDLKENGNSEVIRASCSCNRICIDDLGASTSTYKPEIFHEIGDFESQQARSCFGPFNFFLDKSQSSSFHRTPELFSSATSPIRRVNQEKCVGGEEVHNAKGVEEKQEQCSPVSVLDNFFVDESIVEVEEDHDLERSYTYAKIQRAREKLLERLRRFEKLASLEPLEVEEEYDEDGVEIEDEVRKQVGLDTSCLKQSVIRMVEMMVRSELDEWKISSEEETVTEIEVAILGRLMEEFSNEVCCMDGIDVQHSPM